MKKTKVGVLAALLLMLPSLSLMADDKAASPAASDDENAIRAVLMKTWNRTDAPLAVAPVTIVDGYALAGWVQSDHGGRALLTRKPDGSWSVQLCGGDALKSVETLKQGHLPEAVAIKLSARNAEAEATLPAATRALFSTFGAPVHHTAH